MEEKRKRTVKGIRINTLNLILILISCVLYILLIYATVHVSMKYEAMISDTHDYIACEKNAALVSKGSDYLTEQVRLYTVTMEPEYMDSYFKEANTTQRREKALEQLEQYPASKKASHFLETALKTSNDLMEHEIYAMQLISVARDYDRKTLPQEVRSTVLTEADRTLTGDAMTEKARKLVFGKAYQEEKRSITEDIDYFLNSIVEETRAAQEDSAAALKKILTQQRILISILFLQTIVTFIMILLLIVKPLRIYIDCIKEEKTLEVTGSYEFKYLALTYNDIYEVNAANQAMLQHRAEHDPLTGIMNRGAFDQLKQNMKLSTNPVALLLVDVDNFKQINDEYGHKAGDETLKKIAGLLEKSFRTTDFPARIGGDEFAVIVTDIVPDMRSVIRNKVNAMNKILKHPDDGLPEVSLSVGVAFSPQGFSNDLYNNADVALYDVKEHGRCGCSFYGPDGAL